MNGLEVMLAMTVLRIILPFSMLLAIGEWVQHHGRRGSEHR